MLRSLLTNDFMKLADKYNDTTRKRSLKGLGLGESNLGSFGLKNTIKLRVGGISSRRGRQNVMDKNNHTFIYKCTYKKTTKSYAIPMPREILLQRRGENTQKKREPGGKCSQSPITNE